MIQQQGNPWNSGNPNLALPFKGGIILQNWKALASPVSSRPAVTIWLFCLEGRNRRTSKDSTLKTLQCVVCTGDKDKEEQVHMSLLLFTKNTANMMFLMILFAVLVQKEEVQMGEEI